MRKLRWLILGFTLLAACGSCQSAGDNYTVIISLDGNRWDYPQYYNTEFFDSLATWLRAWSRTITAW